MDSSEYVDARYERPLFSAVRNRGWELYVVSLDNPLARATPTNLEIGRGYGLFPRHTPDETYMDQEQIETFYQIVERGVLLDFSDLYPHPFFDDIHIFAFRALPEDILTLPRNRRVSYPRFAKALRDLPVFREFED